jgi:hypothetical protein
MRKICLALAGSAIAVATPAMAATIIGGPFKNYGDCNSSLHWWANSQRKGDLDLWPVLSHYVGYDLYCLKRDGDWYIAYD